mgnify:CR=1 FL=1
MQGEPLEVDKNRERCGKLIEQGFSKGVNLVVLPELIVQGYFLDREGQVRVSEDFNGPTVESWTKIARRFNGFIAGGFCERVGDSLFNTAVLVGPEGPLIHYRKLHLFDREKEVFEPGDLGLPVAKTTMGVFGICVCYDLRFPEVVRLSALRGVEALLVPTAWTAGFDDLKWDAEGYCPQARGAELQANLSQIFIACASQVGRQAEFTLLGSSLLVGPRGETLLGPLSGDREESVTTEIDLEETVRAQTRSALITPRQDRRTDVYGVKYQNETY